MRVATSAWLHGVPGTITQYTGEQHGNEYGWRCINVKKKRSIQYNNTRMNTLAWFCRRGNAATKPTRLSPLVQYFHTSDNVTFNVWLMLGVSGKKS